MRITSPLSCKRLSAKCRSRGWRQCSCSVLACWAGLGGWASQGDNALFYVQFLDEYNNEIASSAIGPVTPDDRNNQTGLYYRESDGFVPAGTTHLSFWLSMERLVSNDNDGYADNLSFVLQAPVSEVPEPGMAPMFLFGISMLGWARQRQARTRRSLP